MGRSSQPPFFDRDLVDLIASLTDEGQVMSLATALDSYGASLVARVVADHVAVIRLASDVDLSRLNDATFLPSLDAQTAIQGSVEGYVTVAAPWGPIGLEDESRLIFAYCADVPEAVEEVRHRNAERRASWERRHIGSPSSATTSDPLPQ